MRLKSIREFVLPPGPILSLTLIGLLLLSGLLYYRAVKIQRFLEPALALSQPRNEFAESINKLILKEFGTETTSGIKFSLGSILIDEKLLFTGDKLNESARKTLRKIGNVFYSALEDQSLRAHIDLVMVNVRFPLTSDMKKNNKTRLVMQHRAETVMNSMFSMHPEIERNYPDFFVATAMPMGSSRMTNIVEFHVVPTELVHIEALQRLRKYAL